MDIRGFLIRVTDGTTLRHTIVLAPDLEFAQSKAAALFEATKWRITAVLVIAR
jgi:hypothetical protein